MSNKPLISVIVPVFNTEKYLRRCIESLIKQSYENIQIILVDDGSTDDSGKICDEYISDKRIVVVHKNNGGLSDARNTGLNYVEGDYISFVDSDDYIDLDFFNAFSKQIVKICADVIVCSHNRIINGVFSAHKRKGLIAQKVYSQKVFLVQSIKNGCLEAASCFYIYKSSFLLDNCLHFKKGIKHEDMHFLMNFALKAKTFVYFDSNFYYYDTREGSIMTTFDVRKYSDAISIYKEWKEMFQTISDKTLKRYLEGFLCRCLVKTIKDYRKKEIPFSYFYMFKKSLTIIDKLKVIYVFLMRKK